MMKNRFLRSITLFVLMGFLIVLSGCNDRIEVEDLGIVRITGVDWDSENNKFIVTVYVQRPFSGGASTEKGKSTGSMTPWIASAEGESLMDATKNLRSRSSSTLSWHHNTIIIIGEDMANQGVDKIVDFFSRNQEIRYSSNVFVSRGSASELMKATPETTTSLAEEIEGMIKNSKNEWNKSYVPNLKEFLITLTYKDYDSIIGLIEEVQPIPFNSQQLEDVSGIKPSKDVVALEGSSVIKNYKLVGFLNGDETRGYRWIQGKIKMSIINIFTNGSSISVEIDSNKSNTDVEVKDNKVYVNIKTEATAHLVQAEDKNNYISESGIKELETLTNDKIKSEMLLAINKSRELDSDIFGFGRKISQSKPEEWKKLSKNWDEYFKDISVNLEVKTNIKSTGLTSKPITKVDR